MKTGSTLTVPNDAELTVASPSVLTGSSGTDRSNYATITTGGASYDVTFQCDFTGDRFRFQNIGTGSVTYQGSTHVNFGIWEGGAGNSTYVIYEHDETVTWTNLLFQCATDQVTIDNQSMDVGSGTGAINVSGFVNSDTATDPWCGGDATELETNDAVNWSAPTPVYTLTANAVASPDGGVLITFDTYGEDGVLRFDAQRSDGAGWQTVGSVFANAPAYGGSTYAITDVGAEVDVTHEYRIVAVDVDDTSRAYPAGTATAELPAAKRRTQPVAAFGQSGARSELPTANVTALSYEVAGPAVATTTIQTGSARSAEVSASGIYAAGGTITNFGTQLPAS